MSDNCQKINETTDTINTLLRGSAVLMSLLGLIIKGSAGVAHASEITEDIMRQNDTAHFLLVASVAIILGSIIIVAYLSKQDGC